MTTWSAKSVQSAFSTLHRFNPDFASDPMVAGSFVRRQAQFQGGEFDANTLSSLVSARSNLSNMKKLPIPGAAPWESLEKKKHLGLQMGSLEQQMAHGKEEHARRGEEHTRRGEQHTMAKEEHGRRGQKHQMDMDRARTMGPLELDKAKYEAASAGANMLGIDTRNKAQMLQAIETLNRLEQGKEDKDGNVRRPDIQALRHRLEQMKL